MQLLSPLVMEYFNSSEHTRPKKWNCTKFCEKWLSDSQLCPLTNFYPTTLMKRDEDLKLNTLKFLSATKTYEQVYFRLAQ